MSIKDDFNRMIARRNADALLRKIAANKQERAERMPTEQDAIRAMHEAHQRLRELGWRDGRPTAPDGERFAGIQGGSTGIHAYTVERRKEGPPMYMIYDGDLWPTYQQPALWRPWKDTDVQARLRPAYPMPEEIHHPGTSCRRHNQFGQCGCKDRCERALGVDLPDWR